MLLEENTSPCPLPVPQLGPGYFVPLKRHSSADALRRRVVTHARHSVCIDLLHRTIVIIGRESYKTFLQYSR